MKTLSGGATTAVGKPLGEEPLMFLKIEWTTGTLWYCDRTSTFHAAEGRILHSGSVVGQGKADSLSTTGSVSFVLSDSDGALKTLIDANCLEGTKASVYQGFASSLTSDSDLVLLLAGVAIQPEWSEGDRTLSFEVETKIHDLEVGFAIELATYEDLVATTPMLTDEAIGHAWPLCFGSPVHVPALRLLAPPETSLNSTFKKGQNFFIVEDASKFPISTVIDVIIDGIVFSVTVDKVNNRMNLVQGNVPKYHDVPFASRELDEDNANPWVAWIAQDVSLVNNFIYFEAQNGNSVYHRVVRQEGRKIWLDNRRIQKKPTDVLYNTNFAIVPQPIDAPTVIKEVAKNGRDGWGIQMSYVGGATTSNGQLAIGGFRDTVQVISGVTWKFNPGTGVKLWSSPAQSGIHTVKYVANLIPSNEIDAVFAHRRSPRTGRRDFVQVPTSYYTSSLSEVQFGHNATTITLKQPLSEYNAQGWEDQIFVSLKSSVGPNVSSVIQWLLETYSNLTVDTASFSTVHGQVTKYPCGFAEFNKQNVLTFCERIAYEARCALLVEDGIAKLRYLSVEPSEDWSIDEDVVEQRIVKVGNTRTEEIYTQLIAAWKEDYSGRRHKSHVVTKTENVGRFGLRRLEREFTIYNVKSLVEKSARFWAHRMANAWKVLKVNVLHRQALALELFDCIGVDLAVVGASTKSVLDVHSFDVEREENADTTFGLSLWLPILAGTVVQDPNAWLSDADDVLPADPTDHVANDSTDAQWADDLSENYVNQRVATHPAKVVNESADGFGFNVDIYDDGFEDQDGNEIPATNVDSAGARIPFVAYPVEIGVSLDRTYGPSAGALAGLEKYRNILKNGTKIQIFNQHGMRWLFNVPADQHHVPAKINGPTPDALGRIGFTTYPEGFDGAAHKTQVQAIFLGDISSAAVGDKCFLFQRGDLKLAFPLGGGASGDSILKITSHVSGGTYLGTAYDYPGGTPGTTGITLKELNGSSHVPSSNFYVKGTLKGDGSYWFNAPYGC